MVLSFAVNQGAPIETAAGVPLESRGAVDTGCETTSSASYTSATGNMMGGSRKSRRSSSRKDRKDRKDRKSKRHQKKQSGKSSRQRHQRRRLNRTLKNQSRRSRRVDYEQQGGGASYTQLLEATPAYGDAVGSQGAMRAEVGLAKTD